MEKKFDIFGVLALVLLCIIVCTKEPLYASLWLDETVTAWIIKGSFYEVLCKAFEYQAQSPLYFLLLKSWTLLFGERDTTLRFFSSFLTVLDLGALYALSRALSIKNTVFFVIFPFICLEEVIKASFTARPYALALLAVTLSVLSLVRLIEALKNIVIQKQDRIFSFKLYILLYIVSSLFVFYTHYFFAAVSVVHVAICIYFYKDLNEEGRKLFQKIFAACFLAILFFSLPGFYHLWIWSERVGEVSFKSNLKISDILSAFFPRHLSIYVIFSLFVAYVYSKVSFCTPNLFIRAIPLLVWTFMPGLMLLLLQLCTGGSFLIDRYYMWRSQGVALLVGLIFSSMTERRSKIIFFSMMMFFALFLEAQRKWVIEDWRGVSEMLNGNVDTKAAQQFGAAAVSDRETMVFDPTVPVLLFSGLAESNSVRFYNNDLSKEYLTAPFQRYPVPNRLYPIPSKLLSETENSSTVQIIEKIIETSSENYQMRVNREVNEKDAKLSKPTSSKRFYLASFVSEASELEEFFKKRGFSVTVLFESNMIKLYLVSL
jgi:uncharacterized membrane protein